MSLPSLPSQGEDPWFEKRNAWDQAVDQRLQYLSGEVSHLENYIQDIENSVQDLDAEVKSYNSIIGAGRPDITGTLAPDIATRVAAAPSGAVFRSTDGPQGAWEWMKRGTTWVVTQGETGTANITPSEDHWTVDTAAGRFTFRRFGRVVNFNARIASVGTTPANTRTPLGVIPAGFRPPTFAGSNLLPGSIYGLNGAIYSEAGSLVVSHTDWVIEAIFSSQISTTIGVGDDVLISGTWPTTNAWPTTIPGT